MSSNRLTIRRVHDEVLPRNRDTVAQCGRILINQIPTCTERNQERLRNCLRDPMSSGFRSVLVVAERGDKVLGFGLLMHEPAIGFSLLGFLCTAPGRTSGGIGGALYQRCREEARALGGAGLFFEVWSDDPALLRPQDKGQLAQNRARLRFYESFGARPIVGTAWDAPTGDHSTPITHLCYDDLGTGKPLPRELARQVVRAILMRRYADSVSNQDVEIVATSIQDDPVRLREPRYHRTALPLAPGLPEPPIAYVVCEGHEKHEVHDRGYYEAPVRIRSIRDAIEGLAGVLRPVPARQWSDQYITRVHSPSYHAFLKEIASVVGPKSVYPDVFPIRNKARQPRNPVYRAGWYCIDTFTPLTSLAIEAARHAVDCVLTAAEELTRGHSRLAYALVRPPGHHAESLVFGGYCYYNNAAIAAEYLTDTLPRVAILDIDYHHGNGQQEIFYRRRDVLTVSIHGDPVNAYPYFCGFADETGEGGGEGANLNIPLPEGIDGATYRRHGLEPALDRIRAFQPSVLVVALGLDTAKGDPTGTWLLTPDDFQRNGRLIGSMSCPVLVVQEGGYRTRTLGVNAARFLAGLAEGERERGQASH